MSFLQEVRIELIGTIFPEEKIIRAENQGPGKVMLQLSGQCSFPGAREASQEVEVFPKAVAARRCPPRGRPGRPLPLLLLLLLLLEAQPPKRLKETVLHGQEGWLREPRVPFPEVTVLAKAVVFVTLRPCDG